MRALSLTIAEALDNLESRPMAETIPPVSDPHLVQIEPGDRLVVLARTIEAPEPGAETALKNSVADWARFGDTCLGQALYRHGCVFHDAAEAPVWSHLELSYFRNLVPAEVILERVVKPQAIGTKLLRAEILLTTPASFLLPGGWRGSADRPERQVSLEYIQVKPACLDAYREVMRDFCGPAAAKLVSTGRFGTFRAMETAAVLYHDPDLKTDWNQIHLCELDPAGFKGFGKLFAAALRRDSPNDVDLESIFAGLDRMRSVPRWTFNDPIVEADAKVCSNFTAAGP